MTQAAPKPLMASVIVPVYNGATVIGACLRALQQQTVPAERFEIIVVDDGSRDHTAEVVRAFPVHLVTIRHSGPARARNKGASLAKGRIIVFTDADCVPESDWLEKMIAPFSDPEVVGVKGAYLTRQTEPAARFAQVEFETRYALLKRQPSIDFVDTYSGAFRRRIFQEVGGFDPSFPVANNEDVDLSYRVAALGKRMVFVPEARVYHTHPSTWRKYARIKFWRGYWRVVVYRRFAGKALSDSYTPQSLKAQIAALGVCLAALPLAGLGAWTPKLAALGVWALAAAAAGAALFVAACAPFYREARRYDPALNSAPFGLLVRALALGCGVAVSLIKPPTREPHDRRLTAFVFLHMVLDIALLTVAFGLALRWRLGWLTHWFGAPVPLAEARWLWAACVCLWFLVLLANRTYSSRRGKTLLNHVINVVRANLEALAVLTMLLFILHTPDINRSLIGLFMALNTALLAAEKLVLYSVLRTVRSRGMNVKQVLLVGKRTVLADPLHRLMSAHDAGFRVVGILSPKSDEIGEKVLDIPVLDSIDHLEKVLHEHPVDEVFFALPAVSLSELEEMLSICFRLGIQGKLIANVFEGQATIVKTDEVLGMPLLSFLPRVEKRRHQFVKRGLDLVGACLALVALAPLLAAVAALIRVTTRGPAVFTQKRMGLNGRIFTLYKFRTMIEGAEQLQADMRRRNVMNGPVFKDPHDCRVTPIGRWLRRYSIDELPQLWNVLSGEMSLVGPRPLPVYEAKEIRGALRRRVSMKPGMTGLWQVSGRNLAQFEQMMKLDLDYVDHWSIWLDIKIVFKTIGILLTGKGAS